MGRLGLSVDLAACTAASVPLASCTGFQCAERRALFSVLFSEKRRERHELSSTADLLKGGIIYSETLVVSKRFCVTSGGKSSLKYGTAFSLQKMILS